MGTLVTDNFARVAANLGPNWTQLTGGFTVNNGAQATASAVFNAAKYSASQFALNQQLSFTLGSSLADQDQCGVAFRIVDHGNGTYDYYWVDALVFGVSFKKVVGASNSVQGTVTDIADVALTFNPGDVVDVECVGPNIVVFRNGKSNGALINVKDSSLSGTLCGLWTNFTGAGPVDKIASFGAINFNAPSGTLLNVICDGDSKTWGQDSNVTAPWPSLLQLNVTPNNVNNFGVDGQKLSDMITYAPTYIDPLLFTGAINVCIVWCGTNDIANGASAATLFANLQTYCAARRAAGWKVITAPLTSGPGNGFDATVQAFNALLAANPQVADATAVLPSVLTAPGSYLNPMYFDPSSGHLTQLSLTTYLAPAFSQAINAEVPDLFLGSVRVVGSAPAGASDPFLGTYNVIGSAPAGRNNPYLGNVRVVSQPGAGPTNPVLGDVVVVASAPAGVPDNYLGHVAES